MKRKTLKYILCLLVLALLLSGCGREAEPAVTAAPEPVETAVPEPTIDPEELNRGRGQIIIREFMEKNRSVLRDEDGDFSDWIELYNKGEEAVDLEGWTIADEENAHGWELPKTELQPGECLLIFASGKDKAENELHTDFSLSGDEAIYVRNKYGTPCVRAFCGACDSDEAMVRNEEGDFEKSLYPTPGYENSKEGYESFQNSLGSPYPLAINEVVVQNFSTLPQWGEFYDWVEIKNVSEGPVLLSDYCLSDDRDDYTLCPLPAVELQSGGMIIIFCDDDGGAIQGGYGVSLGLNSEKEELYLAKSDGELIDWANLRDIPLNGSYGRESGDGSWRFYAAASPMAENLGGSRRISEKPESLSGDGVFNAVETVRVELQAGGRIYYTLDGSLPTEKSREYTGAISLDRTTVLRAISIEEGCLPSPPLSLSYIINEGHSLPVISLVTDSPWEFQRMYNARQKGLELPGNLSFYEDGGSFSIGCGISLNGETSLVLPKKNMSLRFRGAYGSDKLSYDLYGGGVTEFTNVLLRAGQDYNGAIIRNELAQELALEATDNIINQRSRYGVLYINGVYSGLYTIKEKANEQLYADLAGVSRDSVELVEANAPLDSQLYTQVLEFCRFNDMSIEENYRHIERLVDIDSLIDWLILEGYCGNSDLSSGNLRYVRSTENDGRWRLMFYDLDAAFRTPAGVYSNVFGDMSRQFCSMSTPLMDNEEFRQRFLTRAGELMGSVLTVENVLKKTEELCAVIEPEVQRDQQRLGRSAEDWYWGVDMLKQLLSDYDWQRLNVDKLCDLFGLSAQEKELYFGEAIKTDE